MSEQLSLDELDQRKSEIDKMDRMDMARFIRFAPSAHVILQNKELWKYFQERFEAMGGWSSEVSKEIGWS